MDQKSFFLIFNFGSRIELAPFAKQVSRLGDGYLYALLALLIYQYDSVNGESFVTLGLTAFAIELPLYLFLKNTIRRPRPASTILGLQAKHKASDKFSLPSGHTAAAFLFATLLSFYYPTWIFLFFSVASMIALTRVVLGVHYPSDIAAGILLGCGSALLVLPA